jgi:hypothetical protein
MKFLFILILLLPLCECYLRNCYSCDDNSLNPNIPLCSETPNQIECDMSDQSCIKIQQIGRIQKVLLLIRFGLLLLEKSTCFLFLNLKKAFRVVSESEISQNRSKPSVSTMNTDDIFVIVMKTIAILGCQNRQMFLLYFLLCYLWLLSWCDKGLNVLNLCIFNDTQRSISYVLKVNKKEMIKIHKEHIKEGVISADFRVIHNCVAFYHFVSKVRCIFHISRINIYDFDILKIFK